MSVHSTKAVADSDVIADRVGVDDERGIVRLLKLTAPVFLINVYVKVL
tara:strand:+ start:192 stop:335 length:144 start_codon:yes stop_codon:yes gene_type:complete